MAVTWFVFPEQPKAELLLIDPYTFTEFEDAMLGVLETSGRARRLRISSIVERHTSDPRLRGVHGELLRAHEANLAGTRAAVLISKGACEALPDLRVGRFRIRAFNDAADAAQWLHPVADAVSMHEQPAGQQARNPMGSTGARAGARGGRAAQQCAAASCRDGRRVRPDRQGGYAALDARAPGPHRREPIVDARIRGCRPYRITWRTPLNSRPVLAPGIGANQ